MRLLVAKYRHVFNVGLQNSIVYRWNFALRAVFSLVHLAFVFILWGAAFRGEDTIGGFSLDQTLTYFVTLLVLQFFIGAFNEDYQISEEIRNGLINQFLLKPINYFAYRFTLFLSARLISGLLALVPVVLCLPLLQEHLTFPDEAWRLYLGIPAAFMAALIQFSIAYVFGLLTFWFLEIQSFVILSLAIETVLGGQIFPLDLLPATIFRISQFLPYYYQMYFPAAIFTGRLDQATAMEGLAIQAIWVVLLLAFGQFLWRRGLRRHTAVGG
ncbi:ABC transporter permease [Actomonas aquatica]|uniref:ABC-2 family transporter protein n=1 Tax=Actomonas aquatica TaxID=2866162 RepID=A0ABZ1C8F4_9BACT|nr:ABC-2 family transporter protein [Opitutus sp. WL0086]WRQ87971.1 ABC-2 family transporter protein [Opitutus sp. WL0086]